MNTEQIRDQWNSITGRLRDHWSELSDNDFRRVRGNADQLIGMGSKANRCNTIRSGAVDQPRRIRWRSFDASDGAMRQVDTHPMHREYLHDHYDVLAERASEYSHKARLKPFELGLPKLLCWHSAWESLLRRSLS